MDTAASLETEQIYESVVTRLPIQSPPPPRQRPPSVANRSGEVTAAGASAKFLEPSFQSVHPERTYVNMATAENLATEQIYEQVVTRQPNQSSPPPRQRPPSVANRSGEVTAAGASAKFLEPSFQSVHPERKYANVGTAASLETEQIYEQVATRQPVQSPAPPPPSRQRPPSVSNRSGEMTAAGASAKFLEPSFQSVHPERTYANVDTAASLETAKIYEQVVTHPVIQSQAPPPPRPPSAAGRSGEVTAAGASAKFLEPSVKPALPERTYGNLDSITAGPVAEELCEEVGWAPSTTLPQPPPKRLTPHSQLSKQATTAADTVAPPERLSPQKNAVQAYRRLALANLQAAGVENPEFELVRLYRQHVRDKTHFDQQVQYEAERYQEKMQEGAYLMACLELADEDKVLFKLLRSLGDTEEKRHALCGRTYARYANRIAPWVGPTVAEHLSSFNSQPVAIHERVYKEAVASGLAHAIGTAPVPLPVPPDATRV